ncbi:zinc finger BED domain-containing protein 1-like [Silurus asotus]|uniref:Zinc finger BED domain-containing protein 1-like n=1 Tax=Silurus asotus TaxID=30991 RepID=A0AAD5B4U6_SILAS|nr:zinc finger BED domain-containing protein 1-like [Silurus asotus]
MAGSWKENAMKDSRIVRAVGLCKKLVAHFSHSWKQRRDLAVAQKELNLPEHQLKIECPTRWGSRHAMVQRILEQQAAIGHVLPSNQKARHLTPTWQDIKVLEVINKTLTPLADFTDALLGEQYISISSVKPVLHLFETIMAVKEDDPDLTQSIKSKILHYLQEKYSDPNTQELLDIATVLDPQFKLDYVSEDNKASVKARLKNEMTSIAMQSFPYNCGCPQCPACAALRRKEDEDLRQEELFKQENEMNKVPGDTASFDLFSLQIQALVGRLNSLDSEGDGELQFKLPVAILHRATFHLALTIQQSHSALTIQQWSLSSRLSACILHHATY